MFEKTTRLKLRFDTAKGQLTVEDLWDLPLTGNGVNLDKIAIALSRQIKEEDTESFVVKAKVASEVLQLKFDVVKHVIDVKLAERDAAKAQSDARAKKDKILEIISRKQDQALEGSSLEELQKMAQSL
jgi:hypothetical protein